MLFIPASLFIIDLLFAYMVGAVTGHALQPSRAEVKACAIEEIKTNNVTAEEAIMRCR